MFFYLYNLFSSNICYDFFYFLPLWFFIMVSLILPCLWFLHNICQRTCFSQFFQKNNSSGKREDFSSFSKNEKDFCTKFSIRPVFPSSSFRKQLLAIRLFLSSELPGREGEDRRHLGKKFKLVPNTLKTSLEKHPKKGKRMGLEKGGNF